MSDLTAWLLVVGGYSFLVGCWLLMYHWYRKIHKVRVKWWAIPFCHGAVLYAKRLPSKWEKPL